MKHSSIIVVLFLSVFGFAQDSISVYEQKLDQLRIELGIKENVDFDSIAYNLLSKKLDSLKIKDHQLEDGYEWGGGQIGFEVYLKNNIDRLLSYLKLSPISIDDAKKENIIIDDNKSATQKGNIGKEKRIGPVTDLVVKKPTEKIEKKINIKSNSKNNKKRFFSGLRLASGLGKALIKGESFSEHTSYFEPIFSFRTPVGINVGPLFTSLGFERSNYSFEATTDTVTSYFGSGSGLILFFDLSKMIKIGGDKFGKHFILGSTSYEHGTGFVTGYDLSMFVGSLPVSFFISSRANIITFESGESTYWASAYAGMGIDIR